jgi:hypothetical protein
VVNKKKDSDAMRRYRDVVVPCSDRLGKSTESLVWKLRTSFSD